MQSRPTAEQLASLRNGLRKRNVPVVFEDTAGNWEGVGHFNFSRDGRKLRVQWQLHGSKPKTATFRDLCCRPDLELERLELGWLIDEIIARDAQRIMDCIPGPNEATRETARHWKQVDAWRHWAAVPAGHMKGIEQQSRGNR